MDEKHPLLPEQLVAMNEALIRGSVRQHELAESEQKLNAQLRAEITERERAEEALTETAAKLAQASRSKDEFLAMLSHELRNPLASLRNAVEILQLPEASAEERAEAQRILSRQIENMTRMIDDLLDVSRITKGKITLRKEPVSLEAILTASMSLARTGCAAHHQQLTVAFPAEPVWLEADATRLEQVFNNLLSNACKYGGDRCHIVLRAKRAADTASPEVVVSVRDDGMGIAPDVLPHIFELFVQADHTRDRLQGGLGIGLTLARRLVTLHGGTLEARSEGLRKGAEFIVRLPVLAEAPTPPREVAASTACETPRRILIVDDNADSARSLATIQTLRGHETRSAFTGPDALIAAAEFLPDVVLLDIGLPGMDGFEVARKIRALPALSGVLLAAMSGYGSDQDRAEAIAAGFDHYFVKPMEMDVLRAWMEGLV